MTEASTPVQSVLSIGSHCITSSTLETFGLKRFSGPFDWIFSSVEMVAHCIRDDFHVFLDRKYFKKVPEERRHAPNVSFCDHTYYMEEFGIPNIFNHYDVIQDEHYAYYERCVSRFRAVLNSTERSLLVGLCSVTSDDAFENICDALHEFDGPEVLAIRARRIETGDVGATLLSERRKHKFYEFRMAGDMGPTEFTAAADMEGFRALLYELYSFSKAPTPDAIAETLKESRAKLLDRG